MAFSDAEKSKIRQYLGYADVGNEVDDIDQTLALLDGTEGETIVSADVVRLDAIATALDTGALGTAGIKSADQGAVEFYDGQKIVELAKLGRMLVQRIHIKTSIPIAKDYFASASGCAAGGALEFGHFA